MNTENSPALLITSSFPPGCGGSAALLYELLRHFPVNSLVVVHHAEVSRLDDSRRLPFEASPISIFGSQRWTDRVLRRAPWLMHRLMARQARKMARHHRVHAVYAHYPDALAVVTAWKISREFHLPLVVYFDILWEEATSGYVQSLARCYEHRIVTDAARRFAITEFAADYLTNKHGVPFEVIPHTIDASHLPIDWNPPPVTPRPVIHFAGSVYRKMNLDSIERLAEALPLCQSRPVVDFCSKFRFPGAVNDLNYRFLSKSELIEAQRQAHVLYLPQAFESTHSMMVRNNMPTKIMEYFVSGRPILVHSPADSYLTWLARREGFGYVVDQPDAQALARGMDELVTNESLQRELVKNALRFARTRDSRRWWQPLYDALFPSRSDDAATIPPSTPLVESPAAM